jgi:hypothetical protein
VKIKHLTLMALTVSFGCGTIKQKVDPKDEAIDDMNHQRYEDAIAILESLHATTPTDSSVTVLLASAYTGSVGFDVINAFDALGPFLFHGLQGSGSKPSFGLLDQAASDAAPPAVDPTVAAQPASPIDGGSLKGFESKTVQFLNQLTSNFTSFVNIPFTQLKDRRRLVQALLVLEAIPKDDPNFVKSKIYSALVNALQFLNYTRDSLTGIVGKPSVTFLDAVCSLEIQTFMQNLEASTGYLLSSTQDLTIAYQTFDKPIPAGLSQLSSSAAHVKDAYEQDKGTLSDTDLVFTTTRATYCQ